MRESQLTRWRPVSISDATSSPIWTSAPSCAIQRPMDARLFRPDPMGMAQILLGLSLAERISFDAVRDTLFINYGICQGSRHGGRTSNFRNARNRLGNGLSPVAPPDAAMLLRLCLLARVLTDTVPSGDDTDMLITKQNGIRTDRYRRGLLCPHSAVR